MGTEGMANSMRSALDGPQNIVSGNPGPMGGGTYTMPNGNTKLPSLQDYENVFGPAGRDVKEDLQRSKRHSRWHLPDALKGVNPWLTDRIDGLITDSTNSPFTTIILPYKYIDQVDAKIKWNVWSFDEGLASRVPYESAARTLTQTKRSYAGYTVRQGLAITLEHNFMMSDAGRTNFQNQLKQIVGSIQYTNDIDVHVALVTAPSHAKHMAEKYYTTNKTTHQTIREYVDLFAFVAKNPNAMDIMIEEARAVLKQWGGPEPDFLLTNSRLTFQMTMLPEKTQYLTQGIDGIKRLRQGPDIKSYRGLNIINSRQMAMEDGAPPRDILRRRIRVAEYHRIPWEAGIEKKSFAFYDESKDSWQRFNWTDLYRMSNIDGTSASSGDAQFRDQEWWSVDAALCPQGIWKVRNTKKNFDDITQKHQEISVESIQEFTNEAAAKGLLSLSTNAMLDFHQKAADVHSAVQYAQDVGSVSRTPFGGSDADGNGKLSAQDALKRLQGLAGETTSASLSEEFASNLMQTLTQNCNGASVGKFLAESLRTYLFQKHEAMYLAKPIKDYLGLFDWATALPAVLLHFAQPDSTPTGEECRKAFSSETIAHNEVDKPFQDFKLERQDKVELVIIRPNIEHNMLGIICGKGGLEDLGGTLWGQTELSVYDDSQHGIWGMSYKYNERAIVWNEKSLVRLWDVAYDGYNGGKDCRAVDWNDTDDRTVNPNGVTPFHDATHEVNRPYEGPSMMVMAFRNVNNTDVWPSPILFHDNADPRTAEIPLDGEHAHMVNVKNLRVFNRSDYRTDYLRYFERMPNFSKMHNSKSGGHASQENETSCCSSLAFQGTHKVFDSGAPIYEVTGNGHHGPDYVGAASVRNGKGIRPSADSIYTTRLLA